VPLSFEQVYEQHVGQVYGYVAYRVSSAADAEDLTQLVFERALRAWRRYDERRGTPANWLLTIARNTLIDHRRRDRSATQASLSSGEVREGELPSSAGPEERLGPSPEVVAALQSLRSRDRDVIALRFGADMRVQEIAEIMGLSVANVQQILSRSLRKLRGSLEAHGSEVPAGPSAGDG
jgi:RNA polymerase sigma factor (sigma-70 family)